MLLLNTVNRFTAFADVDVAVALAAVPTAIVVVVITIVLTAFQFTAGVAVMRASTALISPVGKLNDEC